ncbi:hypothetical protein EI94DRAFT_1837235, partial [Lactarius quietus]
MAPMIAAPALTTTTPPGVAVPTLQTPPSELFICNSCTAQLFNHGSRPLHTPTHLTAAFRLRMSSQSDLLRCDPISPQFVPPLAVRAEQPYSSLPYPTGDYTYQGSVVVGQGFTFSPPQLLLRLWT